MSTIVKISDLTQNQIDNIVEELSIVPFNSREETMRKRGQIDKFSQTKQSPITMFITNIEDGTISLPFRFACLFLGKKCNLNIDHKKLKETEFMVDLRSEQIPIMEEITEQLKKYNSTTLGLRPGIGKTILGALVIYLKGLAGIIFLTRKLIGDAWVATFTMCLPNLKVWFVGEETIHYKKKEIPNEMPDIIICMNERYLKIPKEYLSKVGITIFDEAHMFCTRSNVECLLCTQPKYVILETATLARSDDKMERMVQKIAGEHGVFRTPNIQFVTYNINTGIYVQEEKNSHGLDAQKLYKALSEDQSRNNLILNIVKNNPHRKFMLLTRTKGHVEMLSKIFSENNMLHDTMYSNKKSFNDSPCLIGTIPKMGTGTDEARACKDFKGQASDTLIFCLSVKKTEVWEQVKGRIMRCAAPVNKDGQVIAGKTPAVIWLNDRNGMVKSHFKGLKQWINETNGKIVDLEYYPDEVILDPDNELKKKT